MKLLTILLLTVLVSCATIDHEVTLHSWQGEAFGESYSGSCVRFLMADGRPVTGVWEWPSTIKLDGTACYGNSRTLPVLAHEVAHLTQCGYREECAERVAEEWLAAGVTLQDLGWEQW